MKKSIPTLLVLLCILFSTHSFAQPGSGYVQSKIQQGVEQKMDSTYRKKGQKAVKDITYENDKRFNDGGNRVQATISFIDSSFKKDRVKTVMSTKMVFGKNGEAYIMRDEQKDKDLQWFIFNYADKANYMVNPKDNSAMKMPLINFKKMIERQAQREAERNATDGTPAIKATDEYAAIAGYKARKYIETLPKGGKADLWVCPDLRLDLGDNYMFGARLNTYKFPSTPEYKDMANGFVIRMVVYDEDNAITSTRTLTEFVKNKADEQYFDMSKYRVTDVLSGL